MAQPEPSTVRLDWPPADDRAAVTAVEFVREDRTDLLAVADQKGRLRLVNVRNPAEVRVFDHHDVVYGLTHVPLPTDSPGLAATGVGGATRAFASDGRPLFPQPVVLPGGASGLAVEAFSQADGHPVIAVGGKTDDVHLYSGEDGAWLSKLNVPHSGAVREIKAMRLERRLAVSHDAGVTLWDLSGGGRAPRLKHTIAATDNGSIAVFYDPQGRLRLATGGRLGVQIWDPTQPDTPALSRFAAGLDITRLIAVTSPDGDPQLAIAHGEHVTLWSTTTEREDGELFPAGGGHVQHLAKILTGAGTTLLAAADDRGLVRVRELPKVKSTTKLYGRHDRWVNALVAVGTNSSQRVVSASDDRTVRFWNPDGPADGGGKVEHGASVQALAVVPGESKEHPGLIAGGDEDGRVRFWSLADQAEAGDAALHRKVRAPAAFERGGRWLVAAAGAESLLTVLDPRATAEPWPADEFRYPEGSAVLVRALAAQPAAELLAAGDSSGRVTVWDTATGARVWTDHEHHEGQVRTLAWVTSVNGPLLASGGSDGLVYLWSPEARPDASAPAWVSAPFKGHSGPVSALAALSGHDDGDEHLFVSGGADGTIRTWSPLETRERGLLHNAHPSWVRSLLRFSFGGGLFVISGGDDGTVRQWVVEDVTLRSTRHELRLHGFGDRPAHIDLLGRKRLRIELTRLLRLAVPANPGPSHADRGAVPTTEGGDTVTGGPRVIALQGAWGAGKTSLMRMVYQSLRRQPETIASLDAPYDEDDEKQEPEETEPATGRRRRRFTPWKAYWLARRSATARRRVPPGSVPVTAVVPVWFNPWAHKSTDEVWAGLTQAIIDDTRKLLGPTDAARYRYWYTRNLERLDRALVRRTLRQRIVRPIVPAVLAVIAPAIGALFRNGSAVWTGLAASAAIVLGTLAYTVLAAAFRDASEYLPLEMLTGPVRSTAFAARTEPDPLLHDPLYQARGGYLYLVQHDVRAIVDDLALRGRQLVVFVDDLDRCPPDTVAEVFEAINIFLGEDFSNARFVIGLDPSVVTRRLSEALRPEESGLWHYPDDPNPSWSYLRKLCQLPVTLPEITEAHTARLMHQHTPPITPTPTNDAEARRSETAPNAEEAPAGPPATPGQRTATAPPATESEPQADDTAPSADEPTPAASVASGNGQEPLLFEGDPVVRDHLRSLVKLRPHQSVRETKRLLTLWGFYVRLLRQLLVEDSTTESAGFGRDVLTFAEILTRWPALVPALGPASGPTSGLRLLCAAATAPERADLEWEAAVRRVRLDRPEYQNAVANLRKLLARHGNAEVAYYAECVL
ncbi:P-loop NTPase fold protein [Dactylosporangium siamense]|uniref:KAP NTPase domain-containing protein n=1 Tax=Dactylosporangium siamense TaxID=685454 RepID=A0A919UJV8_9ACTN|nr:P-loop NTPase fold protein [Dactylosporangium siamense]GIG53098.1 hypothetical protein Dsi01nite_111390 [Dactylosporangium siamense]